MQYDSIIIGGGHNGLTCAALQASRGRKVLVLEKRSTFGGLAAGEEFHPGYRSVGTLHDTTSVRSSVIKSLDLESYGLKRSSNKAAVFAPQQDGPGLLLFDDPALAREELAAHSGADAERYVEFRAFLGRIENYLRSLLAEAPPSISPHGVGQFLSLLKKGWALRALGRETMYECLRIGPTCVQDWLDEWFETDVLKAALASPGLLGTWAGPRSAGTTALSLMQMCTAERSIIGGPAALVAALVSACKGKGVELRTDSAVARILTEKGRVRGVELADGSSIESSLVVSSVDPKQTFLDLVSPLELPSELGTAISNWRCRGTTAKVNLALDGPLDFACRPGGVFETVRVSENLEEIERAFDNVKYRRIPAIPHLDIYQPTVLDTSLAPSGHHVASVLIHFVPHDVEGGWTDERRAELLESCLDRITSVAPTCRDRIVGYQVVTPTDLERELSLTGGHVHHGEHGLDQLFSLRPQANCSRYTTPLEGLVLCGSGSHPGGGITCAPGQLASAAIS